MVIHQVTQGELTPVVRAAVVANSAFLVKEEATQIKRPILFLCADIDERFTPDLRKHFERTLIPTGMGTFIDYVATRHGFVTRSDGTEFVYRQRDRAVQDAIEYFKKKIWRLLFWLRFDILLIRNWRQSLVSNERHMKTSEWNIVRIFDQFFPMGIEMEEIASMLSYCSFDL